MFWAKIGEMAIRYLLIPLFHKLIIEIIEEVRERAAQKKSDEAIDKIVDAKTPKEQKDALDEFIRDTRSKRV